VRPGGSGLLLTDARRPRLRVRSLGARGVDVIGRGRAASIVSALGVVVFCEASASFGLLSEIREVQKVNTLCIALIEDLLLDLRGVRIKAALGRRHVVEMIEV
jgi:hypothetical protein